MNPHGINTLPDKVEGYLRARGEPITAAAIALKLAVNERSIRRAIRFLASEKIIIGNGETSKEWAIRR